MQFVFNTTYYAIVGPHQEVMSPYNTDHNGMYQSEAPAKRYLTRKIREAEQYSKGDCENARNWAKRLSELQQFKVIPVHVEIGEA
jgi:hypothetical protein